MMLSITAYPFELSCLIFVAPGYLIPEIKCLEGCITVVIAKGGNFPDNHNLDSAEATFTCSTPETHVKVSCFITYLNSCISKKRSCTLLLPSARVWFGRGGA